MIDISSKASLKLSCLAACNNSIEEAEKLYDFMIKDLANIPDYPTPKPSTTQQITQSIDSLFGWIDQNSDKFVKGYNMFQMIRGNAPINAVAQGAEVAAEIPPLPPLS